MSQVVNYWKNPVYREKVQGNLPENPAGDVLKELDEFDMAAIAGGCAWYDISCQLGNQGRFCTLTVECQRNCN